ncbi:MAG: quinoprotein dehydrogenase-associated SoxYZ-like carrier [Pseudomonadota bacterium]|nr:quinoprotein dehydrogenase-associated SoxYZ-like carrier [Pseudomonadota bacterium]
MNKYSLAALIVLIATGAAAQGAPDSWPDLKPQLFGNAAIAEDATFASLQAPPRAEDAALTPVTMTVHPPVGDPRRVTKLSLVIDENPVPLAGEFTLGPKSDVTSLSTRVRVNAYTNMRLIAELSDGSLHMSKTYVKAAGGCSAPASKSLDEANAALGKMKLRVIADAPSGRGDYVVMLRHPNNSGLQMDQITRLYTPARYVEHFAVYQGDDLIFSVEGGISISEDPNFRFDFALGGAKTLRVEASDIDNAQFKAEWPLERGGT